MTETEWDMLMRSARLAAAHRNERVRVVAGKARGRWRYLIACGNECQVCRSRRALAALDRVTRFLV